MRNAGADPARGSSRQRRRAWALLPNHAHLLLRSGAQGLPQVMRSRLTGSALTDNRRPRRVGHLCQNRDTSIVVEEDACFRDLVRYLHLNPLLAGLVPDLATGERHSMKVVGRAGSPATGGDDLY